ncbi:CGNR zinc finger domain-containing protein [Streptomyces sp. S186]|uniref:CGNR zinc finger domain-containing protein n=1 Tax=Streptomyces sp. S186 TaxID=3434395 RepID=UPI003F6627EF
MIDCDGGRGVAGRGRLEQISARPAALVVGAELRCRVAFYDRPRNISGVWHDVCSCGNAATNLRVYRARQRVQRAWSRARTAYGQVLWPARIALTPSGVRPGLRPRTAPASSRRCCMRR